MRQTFALLCASLLAMTCLGAQFVDTGDYRIHYTTFSSMIIPADVAVAHQITRAENRIVVNVSARRGGQPASLKLTGTVTNLLEQEFALDFSEVKEADAVYYLASHVAMEQDILRFQIQATPPDGEATDIRFLRRYD
jgi:hypothetical protein